MRLRIYTEIHVLDVAQPCLTQLSQCTVRRRASDEGVTSLSPPTLTPQAKRHTQCGADAGPTLPLRTRPLAAPKRRRAER